ncbi:MAG: thermonuclease family protein [Sedimentisphaerales bacterium]|nr:thermonuclease family protein [Sedimentisphaerales bacterium]
MKNRKIIYAQSRLQRNILLLLAFLLASAVVWLDRNVISHNKPAASEQKTSLGDWAKYDGKTFTVIKVVDGDTIDINISNRNHASTRIRLLGIDTPETEKSPGGAMYYGKEASEFTSKIALGQKVVIIMDKASKPRDKYHRLLAHIKLANGKILNEELISQGFAYADTRFLHSFYEKYLQLEETAQKEKKGLWGKVTQDQMPKWKK